MTESEKLKNGQIGVIRTDTIYGVVASALNEKAVRRVYALKGRTPTKPCIILISSTNELTNFGIQTTPEMLITLSKYWPGPYSIIISCGCDVPEYLHRGTHTLAFRIPADESLKNFLKESGPLIAPSANPESWPPATTIDQARQYFGDRVDFYLDGGLCAGQPSTVLAINGDSEIEIVRENRR